MSNPRIIAMASQKGGTGKTTTALNLGALLAEMGYKTLLIDMDPQANLTMGLGLDKVNSAPSIYEVLLNPRHGLDIALQTTGISNLDIVPSKLGLAGAEIELAVTPERQKILKNSMVSITGLYDFVIIDTPPSLGLYTQNAMVATREVIVPLQVHVFALKAIQQLQKTLTVLRNKHNPKLHISGVVCTMYDSRNSLSRVIADTIKEDLGDVVFDTKIPMNIALAEAPAAGQPISMYAPNSAGAIAYRKFANEVLKV